MPVKEFTYTRNGRTWTERRWVHERKEDNTICDPYEKWDKPDNFTKEEWAAVQRGEWYYGWPNGKKETAHREDSSTSK